MIVIVMGLPGSGKSYFAQALAKRIDAAYVSSDRVRNEKGARGKYTTEDKMRIYQTMVEKTREHVLADKDIVVDGTFYLNAMIDLFRMLSSEMETPIRCISVVAEERLIKERLSKSRDDSEADFNVYLKIKEQAEPLQIAHVTLQSSQDNLDEMLSRAMDYINSKRDD